MPLIAKKIGFECERRGRSVKENSAFDDGMLTSESMGEFIRQRVRLLLERRRYSPDRVFG